MAAKAQATKEITIPAIDIRTVAFRIVGESPLIMHAWNPKIKQEMLDKMMGKAKSKVRGVKDPWSEFINSMYWLDGKPEEATQEAFDEAISSGRAKFGFPSVAFKASAVSAGYRTGVMKDKVSSHGGFHIDGEIVEIQGTPQMHESMVKVANGMPDIRFRGMFPEWSAGITVRYNAGVFSDEQVVNLFSLGGFAVGVGEWRPERGGSYGMYSVK